MVKRPTTRAHPAPPAIQHEEYIQDAKIAFTVETDHEFTDEEWAMIWLTAERQGLGASRSQPLGRAVTAGPL